MTSEAEWRRVSPIAILYFIFDSLRQAISLWPALVPVLAGGETFRALFISYGLPGLAVLFVVSVLLHFWFFRYRVESDRIQLHTGVVNRKRLTLYFERVQQADIAQPFYFRPFGLATLGLESAGSRQQEVDIPGLKFGIAEDLKNTILERRRVAALAEGLPEAAPAEQAAGYDVHLPWREVARYGLMYNGLLFLAPVIAPFMQYFGPSLEQWFLALEGTALQQFLANLTASDMAWLLGIVTVFAVASGLLLLFALSMLIALVRFWDYRLTRIGDQYQYRAGLGTVKTRGFRLHKLQQVTISQGLVARLLKRHTLMISKVGGAAPGAESVDGKRFLVPVLTDETLGEIKSQLGVPEAVWQRVSPAYILWRGIILGTLLSLLLLFTLSGSANLHWYVLATYLTCLLITWRYWWRFGVHQDTEWLGVRSGFIGSRMAWLPIAKAQKIAVSEPPWLKPLKLANYSVWGAEGKLDVPFIPREAAAAARDQTLYRVVTFRGRWF